MNTVSVSNGNLKTECNYTLYRYQECPDRSEGAESETSHSVIGNFCFFPAKSKMFLCSVSKKTMLPPSNNVSTSDLSPSKNCTKSLQCWLVRSIPDRYEQSVYLHFDFVNRLYKM